MNNQSYRVHSFLHPPLTHARRSINSVITFIQNDALAESSSTNHNLINSTPAPSSSTTVFQNGSTKNQALFATLSNHRPPRHAKIRPKVNTE